MIAVLKDAACLSQAARKWLPPGKNGNATHPSVLTRWSDRGINANGVRVFLKTWRVGGQRMTSQAAIEEFLAALNAGTPTAQQQGIDDAAMRSNEANTALEKLNC